jgi:hypothetical protein
MTEFSSPASIDVQSNGLIIIEGAAERGLIGVDDIYGGSVFPFERATTPVWECPEMQNVMGAIGYRFDGGNVLAPDANRLMVATGANGISVELNRDRSSQSGAGLTGGERYGETVKRRAHPVFVDSVGQYTHDIGLEHTPILAVLGDRFFDYLLPNGSEGIDPYTVTGVYDHSTKIVNSAFFPLFSGMNDRYIGTLKAFSHYLNSFHGEHIDIAGLNVDIQDGLERLDVSVD